MRKTWTANTIQYLTVEEMRRLLRVIDDKRDTAIFLIAYRHGLRASEVGLLKLSDVTLTQHRIFVHRLKDSISNERPMKPDEVRTLKAWLRRRPYDSPYLFTSERRTPISRRMLVVLMKRYGEKADISVEKRHFHVLKHSISTHLLDAGADLRFAQYWLGHASIKNTMIYTHLSDKKRDEEARRVFMSSEVV